MVGVLGTKEGRRSEYQEMIGELRGIRRTNEQIAGNTKPAQTRGADGIEGWLARFANDRARQRFLMETR